MYFEIFMTLKQRSAEKFQVDINFNYLFYFVSLHKGLYMIAYTSGPRAGSLGDFFRQRISVNPQQFAYRSFPYPPSFFSQCFLLLSLDPFFAFVPVCLTSSRIIFSDHFICILSHLLGLHLVCRLSSVPLGYSGVLHPLAVGLIPYSTSIIIRRFADVSSCAL